MVKKRSKPNRDYFTQETEDAILLYNRTESKNQQSKIYSEHIHYPFFKLTQNIIHTFKFYNTDVEDLEHLQHEIIVFLLGKMYLYHHSKSIDDRLYKYIVRDGKGEWERGSFITYTNNSDKITQQQINDYIKTLDYSSIKDEELKNECIRKVSKLTPPKAYSYFGTIVKRWCINYNKKNYDKKISYSPIEDLNSSTGHSYDLYGTTIDRNELADFMDNFIEYMTENIYEIFPKQIDANIADAILEVFRKRDRLPNLDKKAVYKYIREMGDYKTPKITKISKRIHELFEEHIIQYLEEGTTDFQN